ncbi:hypothetical protein SAMN04489760_1182 [Syntrophus gentianae]|uniref:Uncharacterized protein n=1 Tax=Syntrophus gentianae TaxID=43775 RepID=A0A1H7YSW2_9BACT|nr:hypothetical protein [Syntrophus gentianae]SEM49075.1 hypothetical protein SAMN04489760_1182 [Syntrophus gentianae]
MVKVCRSLLFLVLFFLVCTSPFLLSGCEDKAKEDKLSFSTEYQAVFMANGQVFFGRIENAGGNYPLLKEVYYIGRQASPDGKEVKSILIKRGNEWHGPEYMYINKQHIAVIEPVSPTSRVAQLIKDAKDAKPPAAQQQ